MVLDPTELTYFTGDSWTVTIPDYIHLLDSREDGLRFWNLDYDFTLTEIDGLIQVIPIRIEI